MRIDDELSAEEIDEILNEQELEYREETLRYLDDLENAARPGVLPSHVVPKSKKREQRIDLRVVAPFSRLRDRGYLRLLLDAGLKVAAFGLRRGIFGVGSLVRFVRRVQATPPYEWEV